MKDLNKMVDEYLNSPHINWRFKVIEYYKGLPKEEVLKNACLAKTHTGKMDSHQRRVGYKNCEIGFEKIQGNSTRIWKAKTFEDIKIITDKIAGSTHRLGSLWAYDTALRIGFKMHISPDRVYV